MSLPAQAEFPNSEWQCYSSTSSLRNHIERLRQPLLQENSRRDSRSMHPFFLPIKRWLPTICSFFSFNGKNEFGKTSGEQGDRRQLHLTNYRELTYFVIFSDRCMTRKKATTRKKPAPRLAGKDQLWNNHTQTG